MKKNDQNFRYLWNTVKLINTSLIGGPGNEKRRKGKSKKLLERIKAVHIPNFN